MLSLESQQKIEQLLLERKVLAKPKLDKLKKQATSSGKPLLAILVDQKIIDSEELTRLIAKATNVPYVNLSKAVVELRILNLLPRDVAEQFKTVPLGEMEGKLAIGMIDPTNIQAIDYVSGKVGRPVSVFMASQGGIDKVLGQY